jgi:hypothetical protein
MWFFTFVAGFRPQSTQRFTVSSSLFSIYPASENPVLYGPVTPISRTQPFIEHAIHWRSYGAEHREHQVSMIFVFSL